MSPKTPAALSPGRRKLRALGLELPLLPVSPAGSLPKPPALLEARARAQRGDFPPKELEALEKKCVETWVRAQDRLGLDVLTDGEMYRGNRVSYFAEHLPGFYPGGWVRVYENRYYRKPVIAGEVRWPGPVTVKWWRFAQGLTARPVKAVLTGPYTLMDRSFNEYHPTREAACLALAQVVRQEAEALAAAGARVLQIDEPSLSARPEEMPLAAEALARVTENLSVYVVLHLWKGRLAAIAPRLTSLPVDNFDVEEPAADLAAALGGRAFRRDVSLGGADEPPDAARLKAALGRFAADRVWLAPDCGRRGLSVDQARSRLAAAVRAAAEFRKHIQK